MIIRSARSAREGALIRGALDEWVAAGVIWGRWGRKDWRLVAMAKARAALVYESRLKDFVAAGVGRRAFVQRYFSTGFFSGFLGAGSRLFARRRAMTETVCRRPDWSSSAGSSIARALRRSGSGSPRLTNTSPGGHPNYDVCEDTDGANDFGTTNQWATWVASKPPLAPNARLSQAAQKHSQDMAEVGLLTHSSPSSNYYPLNSEPYQRHAAEGYTNAIVGYYENIFYAYAGDWSSYPSNAILSPDIHDWFFVDTGIVDRGHRQAILNATAREIGLGHQQARAFESPYYVTRDYDAQDYGRRVRIVFSPARCFTTRIPTRSTTRGRALAESKFICGAAMVRRPRGMTFRRRAAALLCRSTACRAARRLRLSCAMRAAARAS
ncbi:MAG: CAP domain-containing protein [Kiritimatiellae bacterium]|nr:CAP domain-containing protein [Kiritimatiellia bacterium]